MLSRCGICYQSPLLLNDRYAGDPEKAFPLLSQRQLTLQLPFPDKSVTETRSQRTDSSVTTNQITNNSFLYCDSCVTGILLKHKVEYLSNLIVIDQSKKQINSVLRNSLKSPENANIKFLTQYLREHENKAQNEKEDVFDDSSGGFAAQQPSSSKLLSTATVATPSEGSVAALSAQILTIESLIIAKKISMMQNNINVLKEKINTDLKEEKRKREEILKAKKSNYETHKKQLTENFSSLKSKIETRIEEKKLKLIKTDVLINNQKAILFQTLCKFMLVKKHRIKTIGLSDLQQQQDLQQIELSRVSALRQNTGLCANIKPQYQLTIGFQPVLAVNKLIQYNSKLVTSSLESVSQFLLYSSYYLSIDLPFKLELPDKSNNFSYVIQGLNDNFNDNYLKIKIKKKYLSLKAGNDSNSDKGGKMTEKRLDISPRNLLKMLNEYSYDELFNSKNVLLINKSIANQNLAELFEIAIILAKLLINLYVMSMKLQLISQTEPITYNQLFKLDEMIYLLTTGGDHLNAPSNSKTADKVRTRSNANVNATATFIKPSSQSPNSDKRHNLKQHLKEQLSYNHADKRDVLAPASNKNNNNEYQHRPKPTQRKSSLLKYFFTNNSTNNQEPSVKNLLQAKREDDFELSQNQCNDKEINSDSEYNLGAGLDYESYIEIKRNNDQLSLLDNNDDTVKEFALGDLTFRIFRLLHTQATSYNGKSEGTDNFDTINDVNVPEMLSNNNSKNSLNIAIGISDNKTGSAAISTRNTNATTPPPPITTTTMTTTEKTRESLDNDYAATSKFINIQYGATRTRSSTPVSRTSTRTSTTEMNTIINRNTAAVAAPAVVTNNAAPAFAIKQHKGKLQSSSKNKKKKSLHNKHRLGNGGGASSSHIGETNDSTADDKASNVTASRSSNVKRTTLINGNDANAGLGGEYHGKEGKEKYADSINSNEWQMI